LGRWSGIGRAKGEGGIVKSEWGIVKSEWGIVKSEWGSGFIECSAGGLGWIRWIKRF
jgi:hypothetical protein